MHPEVPSPTAAAIKNAIERAPSSSVSSKSANVRDEVEQTLPILDWESEAKELNDSTMDDERDEDNDKTIAAARDYQVIDFVK